MAGPQFKFDKKSKFEFKHRDAFKQDEVKQFQAMEEQMDFNAYLYEDKLSQMSEEEVLSAQNALEEGYYTSEKNKIKGGNATERQERKMRADATKKMRSTNARAAKMKKQIGSMAEKYASSHKRELPAMFTTSLSLQDLQKKKVPANLKGLQNRAPGAYKKYRELQLYYEKLSEASDTNADMLFMVKREYENARDEWIEIEKTLSEEVFIPGDKTDAWEYQSMRTKGLGPEAEKVRTSRFLNIEVKDKKIEGEGRHPIDREKEAEIIDKIKKRVASAKIDWNADLDAELKEAESKMNAIDKEKNPVEYSNQRKKYLDLTTAVHIKRTMKKIIKSDKTLTMEAIETTVTNYLKKIAANAEFRFVANPQAVHGIMASCNLCNVSENYIDHLEMNYGLEHDKDLSMEGNFTFGYLGVKEAKNMDMSGRLSGYGSVSMKLYRDRAKETAGFNVGNSMVISGRQYVNNRSRSVDDVDIMAAGNMLENVYKRAAEIESGKAKMLSVEQEAHIVAPAQEYFEWQKVGRISAADIEEVTYITTVDLKTAKNKAEIKQRLLEDEKLKRELPGLYTHVNLINKDPMLYGREGMPSLKLVLWSEDGVTLSFNDLKSILGDGTL